MDECEELGFGDENENYNVGVMELDVVCKL